MELIRYESLAEAIVGSEAPLEITSELCLLDVPYVSFEGELETGQLVIHQEVADEAQEIFAQLCKERFPIQKIVPIVAYGWDDEASMADNNTSAFNYRTIIGTDRFSNHSLGRAIDINPLLNPYFAADGRVYPHNSPYTPTVPGTLLSGSSAVEAFKQCGWTWGGDWIDRKDYQHFEKK